MSFLGKLGIGGRFRLAFSALLVAVLLVGGIGAFQAYQMNGITSELAENRLPSVRTMGRLNAGVARYRQIQASLLLVSAEGRAEIVGRMNATVAEIEGAQRDYERLLDPGEEAQVLYPAILSAWSEYQRVSAPLTTPGLDLATAATIYLQDIYPAFQALRAAIQKDLDYNQRAAEQGAEDARAAFSGALWMSGGITVLAAILALLMGRWLTSSVTRRVVHVSQGLRRLAERDYAFDLPTTSLHDEIGDMVRAIDACRTGLREADAANAEKELEQAAKAARAKRLDELMRTFESKAGQMVSVVSSAAAALQATAETMSGTAGRTAEGAKSVGSAASRASGNVQTVAAAAEELASSVSEITRQVTQSAGAASKASGQAAQTQGIVQKLAEAAERIGTVVSIISDIAGQTNLLALNATIEAARAGDAGKGFAVVASEVKTLASQTAKATDEIGTQINQMQTATREAVSAIGSITGMIEEVSQTTAAIAAAIEEQGAATQEIARNVQQAAAGTRDVTATIQDVGAAAEETGQGARAVRSAAHDLTRQAEGLDSEMQSFLTGVRAA